MFFLQPVGEDNWYRGKLQDKQWVPGYALVDYIGWLTGTYTNSGLLSHAELATCKLYKDERAWAEDCVEKMRR